jgi:aminoglycoside phosphotransferase (APT) family kinase protein
VVHLEECNETLQRSVMVTTEIRGRPVGHLPPGDAARDVFMAAGRELAILNSVPVAGFGWIRREAGSAAGLRAEMPSNRAFLLEHLDQYLSTLDAGVLTPEEVRAIRQVIDARVACLDTQHAHLAHGDFDLTHIYEEHGRYTGIIDFGEIRGTGPWYDLGHFRLHDGETAPYEALPHLLAGFRQVEPLPPCSEHDIAFLSLLVGIRFLARGLNRLAKRTRSHAQQSIRRDLALLSDGM